LGGSGDSSVQLYRLQQPLWTGGRLTAGLEKARAGSKLADASIFEAIDQIAYQTVHAWGDWQAASLKLAAYQKSQQTHRQSLEQVTRRVKEGASTQADLIFTSGRLDQVNSQVAAMLAARETAQVKLEQLIGGSVKPDALADSRDARLTDSLDLLINQALGRNPQIMKLEAQTIVLEQELAERKADLQPEVFLRAEHQRGDFSVSNTAPTTRVLIGLATRFGAGLSSLSAVEASRKRLEILATDRETIQRGVHEQVTSDWAQLKSLRVRLPALAGSLEAATATVASWDRQFLAGRKSWLEVMNAARELSQAEAELADAAVALQVNQWRLIIASRGVLND
jgi:adhesin transport system outer membrane protein